MNWRLDIRPDALADIEEAVAWYEQRQPGLGADFARAVQKAINALPQNPLSHRLRDRRQWCVGSTRTASHTASSITLPVA